MKALRGLGRWLWSLSPWLSDVIAAALVAAGIAGLCVWWFGWDFDTAARKAFLSTSLAGWLYTYRLWQRERDTSHRLRLDFVAVRIEQATLKAALAVSEAARKVTR